MLFIIYTNCFSKMQRNGEKNNSYGGHLSYYVMSPVVIYMTCSESFKSNINLFCKVRSYGSLGLYGRLC